MRRISAVENFSKGGKNTPSRQAFTLIELMIVIVVIAILLGLLLPAIMGAFRTARDGQVQMEIGSLEQGIGAFKAQFNTAPPSQITLYETATGWVTDPISRANIRSIWPRFNFGLDRDINLDGDTTDTINLRGAECLVFFLGGIRAQDASSNLLNALTGFAKNPANPFAEQIGDTRDSFYDFAPGRLVNSNNDANFLIYIDPLPGQSVPYAPYIYASSYEGRGYVAADLYNGSTGSAPTNAYRPSTTTYLNPKTFQIISPGADHVFGVGGTYIENSTTPNFGLTNRNDYDNLTNFHNGRLKP